MRALRTGAGGSRDASSQSAESLSRRPALSKLGREEDRLLLRPVGTGADRDQGGERNEEPDQAENVQADHPRVCGGGHRSPDGAGRPLEPGATKAEYIPFVTDFPRTYTASHGETIQSGEYGMPTAMPSDYAANRVDRIELARLQDRKGNDVRGLDESRTFGSSLAASTSPSSS